MVVRRLILIGASLVIGYGATFLIVIGLGTTPAEFWMGSEQPVPIPYFILTGFFIALAAAVWLDKFLDTKILPK